MPNEITVTKIDYIRSASVLKVDESLEGFMSFAFPGRFIGVGETREEAMLMAKMRLKASRKSHVESGKTEAEWEVWAKDRGKKILEAHLKLGISKAQVWDEDNLEKK